MDGRMDGWYNYYVIMHDMHNKGVHVLSVHVLSVHVLSKITPCYPCYPAALVSVDGY